MAFSEETLRSHLELITTSDERDTAIEAAIHSGRVAIHCGPWAIGDQHLTLLPTGEGGVGLWTNEITKVGQDENKQRMRLRIPAPGEFMHGVKKALTQNEEDISSVQMMVVSAFFDGLSYQGFERREGWRRQAVHYDELPTEIRPGDQVVLGFPNGESLRTRQVREPEAHFALAAAAVELKPVPVPA